MVDLEDELDRSFCSLKNVLHPNETGFDRNEGKGDEDEDDENEDLNDITDLSHEMTLYSCHKRMRYDRN